LRAISFASNFDNSPFLRTSETLVEADALHHVITQLSAEYSAQLSRHLGESQRQCFRMLRTQQTEARVVAGMTALQREHASDKEMLHGMLQHQDMVNGMHQATTRDLTVFERDLKTYEHVSRQLASMPVSIFIMYVVCICVACLLLEPVVSSVAMAVTKLCLVLRLSLARSLSLSRSLLDFRPLSLPSLSPLFRQISLPSLSPLFRQRLN